MLKVVLAKSFKRCFKAVQKQGKDMSKLTKVMSLLENELPIPPEYKDHPLQGKHIGRRELHIEPDWLLVYKTDKKELVLYLISTGTHQKSLHH
ncbi:MAG: type II toxin-antitoxin system YafQ family toxin [Ruminococcus sp.]|jgi:mRNA interferase YafQ|nr:type II toxin-antitoxin system YafQ family toxin [Ruminococcus sp.]